MIGLRLIPQIADISTIMTNQQDPCSEKSENPPHFKALMSKSYGQKQLTSAFWTVRVFFRWWTPYVSYALIKLGFSANNVTFLSGIVFVAGALCLGVDDRGMWLLGGLLVVFYHALDMCDGEVARYYRKTNQHPGGQDGQFWDYLVHGLEPVLIGCIAYRMFLTSGMGTWVWVIAIADCALLCMAPWQRYCNVMMEFIDAQQKKGRDLNEALQSSTRWAADGHDGKQPSTTQKLKIGIKQLLLFPGYFLTLMVAVLLDVFIGPITLIEADLASGTHEVKLYFVFLWLIQHALGRVLGVTNKSITCGKWLRQVN